MGENILILAFVIIVIGGIGSDSAGAFPGRDLRRNGRYAGPRLPARFVAKDPLSSDRRFDPPRPPAISLDADLSPDGHGAGGAAGGACFQPIVDGPLRSTRVTSS